MTKKARKNQKYEDYWKLTVEYSRVNGYQFINTLRIIVNFIDAHPSLKENYNPHLYQKLQKNLMSVFKKRDSASARKSINQFVKLGFIYPKLKGYRDEAILFLKCNNDNDRDLIFSEVYYKYSSFNSSVMYDNTNDRQINFLLKTLMHKSNRTLTRQEIIGMMLTDLSVYPRGYILETELNQIKNVPNVINFEDRKYNQINFFMNFLKYVPGIKIANDQSKIEYVEDDYIHIKDYVKVERDQTLFRIMREKIKSESIKLYGNVVCYYSKMPLKGLVVSHIIPSQKLLDEGNIKDAYDPYNALLLEPNIDAYFDKFDMTFSPETGKGIYSETISKEFIDRYKMFFLDSSVLTDSRKNYLSFHNNEYKKKFER